MQRIKNLNLFQKTILILLALMFVAFTIIYSIISSRLGFEYKDFILLPSEENGNIVYSGKIKGERAIFTVSPENSVIFQYGEKQYGPYIAKEDPSAVPEDHNYTVGVELREGDEIIFRGGVVRSGNSLLLFDESGSIFGLTISYTDYNGTVRDADGNVIDEMEPSASTILKLMDGPELTSKGDWLMWFYGVIISVVITISIMFADELFRWNLSFQIRNSDRAVPSELEMASRYIAWTVVPIVALVCYIAGLLT